MPETKSTTIYDTGLTKEERSGRPRATFPSASSYSVGETFQSSSKKTAVKSAEITIHVYQIEGETDFGYSVEMKIAHTFDKDRDTAEILGRISKNFQNRYKNRRAGS